MKFNVGDKVRIKLSCGWEDWDICFQPIIKKSVVGTISGVSYPGRYIIPEYDRIAGHASYPDEELELALDVPRKYFKSWLIE